MLLGKIILGVSALAFTGYGLVCLGSPDIPAAFAGLQMTSGDAFAEVGAMYGGLQTGFGLFCLLALLKPDYYRAGLMILVLVIGALALARLFSFAMTADAVTAYTYVALGYEFATAILAATALMRK
ncbi:MAG: hypothetical protein ACI9SX_001517 [Pseudoalteromonas tetraodonis]|jgi:hypothetical protein